MDQNRSFSHTGMAVASLWTRLCTFNPKFIMKLYSNKEKTKILSPEIYKIDSIDDGYIFSNHYKYNIEHIGEIRLNRKGKGSAFIHLLLDHRPSIEEIQAISEQFLNKLKNK